MFIEGMGFIMVVIALFVGVPCECKIIWCIGCGNPGGTKMRTAAVENYYIDFIVGDGAAFRNLLNDSFPRYYRRYQFFFGERN